MKLKRYLFMATTGLATVIYFFLFINYDLNEQKFHVKRVALFNISRETIEFFLPEQNRNENFTKQFVSPCVWDDEELGRLFLGRPRKRLHFSCTGKIVVSENVETLPEAGPLVINWSDSCLHEFTRKHCYQNYKIPNLIHYIWFGQRNVTPECLVSVLSVVRFQQPCAVLFHSDVQPTGLYWHILVSTVPQLVLIMNKGKQSIFGRKFGFVQHKADVARIEILQEMGGIYLDIDQLLLRNVDKYRNEDFVMSMEGPRNLANSFIMSVPRAKFIDLWYRRYRFYHPRKWGYDSTFVPFEVARNFPKLIRIAGHSFVYPDLGDIQKVFKNRYNLTQNYGIHLYTRLIQIPLDITNVSMWNTSLGDIWRLVLYGRSDFGVFQCDL